MNLVCINNVSAHQCVCTFRALSWLGLDGDNDMKMVFYALYHSV